MGQDKRQKTKGKKMRRIIVVYKKHGYWQQPKKKKGLPCSFLAEPNSPQQNPRNERYRVWLGNVDIRWRMDLPA